LRNGWAEGESECGVYVVLHNPGCPGRSVSLLLYPVLLTRGPVRAEPVMTGVRDRSGTV